MSTNLDKEQPVDTVTVEPGSQTKYFFITISELQKDTNFRDIWVHLKKRVKRLEHIEIQPDSSQGWICVHKHTHFLKVLEMLQTPVHVEATGTSSMIIPAQTNENEKLTIKLPINCSTHVSRVIDSATQIKPRPNPIPKPEPKPEPKESHTSWKTPEPVIAHGSYSPDLLSPPSPKSVNSLPAYAAYPPAYPPAPAYDAIYPVYQPTIFDPYQGWYAYQPPELCAPYFLPSPPTEARMHLVLLSNFHPITTAYDVERLVWLVVQGCKLQDPRIQVVHGSTIFARTKSDAWKLRNLLNGQLLNGVHMKAQKGPQQPCWFAPYYY
ncbi:hypothetical protein F5Y09DRAFT_342895 [Xylaria sp. FL1042]|nr:hypothetical protein F5Y09DRAFT_342895 [Xylaria sp. FL1042]